jgi:hypothetical protein
LHWEGRKKGNEIDMPFIMGAFWRHLPKAMQVNRPVNTGHTGKITGIGIVFRDALSN